MSYDLKPIINPAVNVLEVGADGFSYRCLNGLKVIQSVTVELDGKEWVHTSFSRRSRMPTYHDIKWIKDLFIGPYLKAIMILPKETEHINLHPYCLHLYTPLGNDPLPDFTHGLGTI